jgi:hypothetical protein
VYDRDGVPFVIIDEPIVEPEKEESKLFFFFFLRFVLNANLLLGPPESLYECGLRELEKMEPTSCMGNFILLR